MASVTLAESAKLAQDMLVSGIIDTLITSDQLFQVLPFESFSGSALAYNRYNTHGDAVFAGVGTVLADGSAYSVETHRHLFHRIFVTNKSGCWDSPAGLS